MLSSGYRGRGPRLTRGGMGMPDSMAAFSSLSLTVNSGRGARRRSTLWWMSPSRWTVRRRLRVWPALGGRAVGRQRRSAHAGTPLRQGLRPTGGSRPVGLSWKRQRNSCSTVNFVCIYSLKARMGSGGHCRRRPTGSRAAARGCQVGSPRPESENVPRGTLQRYTRKVLIIHTMLHPDRDQRGTRRSSSPSPTPGAAAILW